MLVKNTSLSANFMLILNVCLFFYLLLEVHHKQLRSCWGGQFHNNTVPEQASQRQFTSI